MHKEEDDTNSHSTRSILYNSCEESWQVKNWDQWGMFTWSTKKWDQENKCKQVDQYNLF